MHSHTVRILAGVLVCLGVGLRLANLGNVASRTPDERVYTHQANVWLRSGAAGIQSLVEEYDRDPRVRDYPTPTRVGMIRGIAATMRLGGMNDERAGASMACAASIGSLLVAAVIGLRFFPPWSVPFALLFYAVSPAELAIARRAWPDAIIEFLGILLVAIACEITAGSRRRIWFPIFAALGSAGIAIKESFPVSYGLCAIWVVWILAIKRREWKNTVILIASGMVGLALVLGWLANAVGSLSVLVRIMSHVPAANAVNPYALEYASGPPWLLLDAFWIVSPIPALFVVAGFYAAFARMRGTRNERVIAGMAMFTVCHLVVALSLPHFLNLRYISVLFGPLYLLAGLGFWRVGSISMKLLPASERWAFAVLAAAFLMTGAFADYSRFRRFFVRDAIADLSIKMLRDEQASWPPVPGRIP